MHKSNMPENSARKVSIAEAWTEALRPMNAGDAGRCVKNSLQRVASLLQLQAAGGALTRPDEALADAAARIKAIAHWHAFLAAAKKKGERRTIALDGYLYALVDHFIDVFAAQSRTVLLVNADPIRVPSRVAGMLGQIVNELVIDAIRHSFGPTRPGTIQIECGTDADGSIVLQVSDDGKGYVNGAGLHASGTFGIRTVKALAEHLGGTFAAPKSGVPARHRVTIPMAGRASSANRKRRVSRGQAN